MLVALLYVIVGLAATSALPVATDIQEGPQPIWKDPTDKEIHDAVISSMIEYEKHRVTHVAWSPINVILTSTSIFSEPEPEQVCYENLDCFVSSGPFEYLHLLPAPPEQVKTKYLFYEANPPGDLPVLIGRFSNVNNAWDHVKDNFNTSAPTKIVIHGFGASCASDWLNPMIHSLSSNGSNVICVDWSEGAKMPNYWAAAANTRLVGKQTARLVQGLQEHAGLKLESLHIIGHSLGAHLAGFIGYYQCNISRITGLDPAGPLFTGKDPEARLDETDAQFVDIIHTNAKDLGTWEGFLWEGGLGTPQHLGHVDFFPNGGEEQDGCPGLFKGVFSGDTACSHSRSIKYFTESVKSSCLFMASPCTSYTDFLAKKCFQCTQESCGPMGYHANLSPVLGALYLKTDAQEPFCGYHYLATVESSLDQIDATYTYGKLEVALSTNDFTGNKFSLTESDKQTINPGDVMNEIVIVPPIPSEPTFAELTYTSYKGWFAATSGLKSWRISKIVITERFGKQLFVCEDVVLETGVKVRVPLVDSKCST